MIPQSKHSIITEVMGEERLSQYIAEHDVQSVDAFDITLSLLTQTWDRCSDTHSKALAQALIDCKSTEEILSKVSNRKLQARGMGRLGFDLGIMTMRAHAFDLRQQGLPEASALSDFIADYLLFARARYLKESGQGKFQFLDSERLPELLAMLRSKEGLLDKFLAARRFAMSHGISPLYDAAVHLDVIMITAEVPDRQDLIAYTAIGFAMNARYLTFRARVRWFRFFREDMHRTHVRRLSFGIQRDIEECVKSGDPGETLERCGRFMVEHQLYPPAVIVLEGALLDADRSELDSWEMIEKQLRIRTVYADALHSIDRWSSAREVLEVGLAIYTNFLHDPRSAGSRPSSMHLQCARAHQLLGSIYSDLGAPGRSAEHCKVALEEARFGNDLPLQIACSIDWMFAQVKLDHKRIATLYGYELEESTRKNMPQYLPHVLCRFGQVLQAAGQYAAAKSRFEEAVRILRDDQPVQALATLVACLFGLGREVERSGDLDAAFPIYDRALTLSESLAEKFAGWALYFDNLSRNPSKITDKALDYGRRLAMHGAQTGDHGLMQSACNVAAIGWAERGLAAESIELLRHLREILAGKSSDSRAHMEITLQLAMALAVSKGSNISDEALPLALECADSIWSRITPSIHGSFDTTSGLAAEFRFCCDRTLEMMLVLGSPSKDLLVSAFNLQERCKALDTLHYFAHAEIASTAIPLPLRDLEKELRSEVARLSRKSYIPTDEEKARLAFVEVSLRDAMRQISEISPPSYRMRMGIPATVDDVASFLRERSENCVYISYHCTGSETFIFVVDSDGIRSVMNVRLGASEIAQVSRKLRRTFDGDAHSFPPFAPLRSSFPERRSIEFIHALDPLVDYGEISTSSDIAFTSLDSSLEGFPLHALRLPDTGTVLAETILTCYTPSASMMVYHNLVGYGTAHPAGSDLFLADVTTEGHFGDASGHDVANLEAAGLPVTVAFGNAATPKTVRAALGNHRYVHLVCHGWIDEVEPLDSGLVLSNGHELPPTRILDLPLNRRIGHMLRVREFGQRVVGTELVTLRSCGAGRFAESAEGVEKYPLAEIMLFSGVRATSGALWNVDAESSRLFFDRFYHALAASTGGSKLEAFREAQHALRSGSAGSIYRHVFHWAPFVMFGDWSR